MTVKKSIELIVALMFVSLCQPFAQAKGTEKLIISNMAPNLFGDKAGKLVRYSPEMIPVCFNFGCKAKEYVKLTDVEWTSVKVIFEPPTNSPDVERIRIAKAVARLETLVGKYTPIHRDIGLNLGQDAVFPGQLDCIDESINTTTFLHVLEREDLFRHHKVVERAYRRAIFDQHWTGQVEQLSNGDRYVIDTWFYDNGELPIVQTTEEWLDISIFTSYNNNSGDVREPSTGSRAVSQQENDKDPGRVN